MAITSKTNPLPWAIPDIEKYFNDDQLVIPTYQRGIVWGQDKQLELMKSVFARLPIGSLLVWQTTTENRVRYHLIDGLQRTTTILEFLKAPLQYVQIELLEPAQLASLCTAVREATKDDINDTQIEAELRSWVKSITSTAEHDGFSAYRLVQHLLKTFGEGPTVDTMEQMEPQCAVILDAIRKQITADDYKVPVIVYEGPEADLPGIFERINSMGEPLSKYQRFAASWSAKHTRIASAGIRAAVHDKYKQLEDHGFVVADYDSDDPDYEYDLFEYLFGLGKHLAAQHRDLLSYSEDVADIESASFSIATISHGLRMGDMNKLPERFYSASNERIDPGPFEQAVTTAFAAADSVLKPLYQLKLNAKSGAPAGLSIPELQLMSFVCALLTHRYQPPEFTQRSDWTTVSGDSYKAPMRRHLLADLLQRNWRGSGDSRLYSMAWQDAPHDTPADKLIPSGYYRNPVSWEDMEKTLNSWFEESLQSEQRERAPVRAIEKIVMRFIYMGRISVAHNVDKEYEIDHVLPVSRLVKFIPETDRWPISCIANLTLLEGSDNRRKSTQTLKEYVDELSNKGEHAQVASIQALALHPIGDCDIVVEGDAYPKEKYLEFLRSRWEGIKAALKESLYG